MALPVEADDVLVAEGDVVPLVGQFDHPAVGSEADGVADGEVDAAVPVDDDHQEGHDLQSYR